MNHDNASDLARARAVKAAHAPALLKKANVVGVGVGLREQGGVRTGEVALVVMVSRKVPLADLAPADVTRRRPGGCAGSGAHLRPAVRSASAPFHPRERTPAGVGWTGPLLRRPVLARWEL